MKATYPINEIFYSLQGEGFWSGRAAIFIRFSGCNLSCPFCDTNHKNGRMMTVGDIVEVINKFPSRFIIFTGGEPSLFISEELVVTLHDLGYFISIETNGTHKIKANIDWITLSPKDSFVDNGKLVLTRCNELKVIFTGKSPQPLYDSIKADWRFIQPCDVNNIEENKRIASEAVEWCKSHPDWRLSIQLHKLLDFR